MMPFELKTYFFMGFAAIVAAAVSILFSSSDSRKFGILDWMFLSLWSLVAAFFYAQRSVAGDTEIYLFLFDNTIASGFSFSGEWAFDGMIIFLNYIGLEDHTLKFFAISFLMSFVLGLGLMKMQGDKWIFTFSATVCLFSFYSIQTVVIRQGIAIAVAYLALGFFASSNRLKSTSFLLGIFLICLSAFFHMSVAIVCGLMIGAWLLGRKWYLGWWAIGVASIVSYLGFNPNSIGLFVDILGSMREGHFLGYVTSDSTNYRVGFRWDFWLFIIFFGVFASWIKLKLKNKEKFFNLILNLYLLSCAVFILAFNVPFSDRIGIFSFFLIPLIISLPIFGISKKQLLFPWNRGCFIGIPIALLGFSYIYFILLRSTW